MKRLLCFLCLCSLLVGCTPAAPAQDDTLTITATTYPVYLFARAVTADISNITVERLDTGSVSCLHDYTLSVNDMKKIERSDVLALSGVGLEAFMTDALSSTRAHVIDCSQNVELLDGDPHYWLDPSQAQVMVDNLYRELVTLLPEQAQTLETNATQAKELLAVTQQSAQYHLEILAAEGIAVPGLISFHDGFRYFAHALNIPVLRAIEEEAGSEASAKEMDEVIRLVRDQNVPVVFTETNGSDATANAIARETGCRVATLSMLMDGGDFAGAEPEGAYTYMNLYLHNVRMLVNGFAGREVLHQS